MGWRRSDDKPSADPIMAQFTAAYDIMRYSASISLLQLYWVDLVNM